MIALVTAAFLIAALLPALEGIGHARLVATMFALSLGLLIGALVELTLEIRIYMANMHLEVIAAIPDHGFAAHRNSAFCADYGTTTHDGSAGEARNYPLAAAYSCLAAIQTGGANRRMGRGGFRWDSLRAKRVHRPRRVPSKSQVKAP